jgi:spermidine synthase
VSALSAISLLALLVASPARAESPRELALIPVGGTRITSEYSNIIVGENKNIRTLIFVRDSGEQMVESQMDMAVPQRLLIAYTRSMFASYLFVPNPTRVLLVGLGGGSMVRFLEHYEPQLYIDAVDIDPAILTIASDYFGTRPSEKVKLVAADGFAYIENSIRKFDVIYMDAFLKPSEGTDSTGVPLDLKTAAFYQSMQTHLTEAGAVVFNLNEQDSTAADVRTIEKSFASTHVFEVEGSGNLVVVATRQKTSADPEALATTAREVGRRFRGEFSFENLLRELRPATGASGR